uniref:F-box domain-containing protein n=1 Tax=Setaria digitata TaxID=48799 RepID=A0A915PMX1_9BILA
MPLKRELESLTVLNKGSNEDDSDSESNLIPLFAEESRDFLASQANVQDFQSSSAEAALHNFRKEWRSELDSRLKETTSASVGTVSKHEQLLHDAATKLFLEGVDCERQGNMWEAVQRYMNAVRMVPDIESKLYKDRGPSINPVGSSNRQRSHSKSRHGSRDLQKILHKRLVERGRFFEPELSDEPCPFARLPMELLSTLMRYIVGSELDVYCLELLSMTSAGFYLLARDGKLWHAICRLTFGAKYVNSISLDAFTSWRQIYITCPHPYLHGIYIGKTTYLRNGEASFQIVIHVELEPKYPFVCLGTVAMIITSEAPAQVVGFLKSKTPRLTGVLIGRYWMVDEGRIGAQFHRRNEKPVQRSRRIHRSLHQFLPYDIVDQKLDMKLHFGDGKKRQAHCVLQFYEYNCTVTYLDGQVSYSALDTTDHQAYPPLFFSRVKSYAAAEGYDEILA